MALRPHAASSLFFTVTGYAWILHILRDIKKSANKEEYATETICVPQSLKIFTLSL